MRLIYMVRLVFFCQTMGGCGVMDAAEMSCNRRVRARWYEFAAEAFDEACCQAERGVGDAACVG